MSASCSAACSTQHTDGDETPAITRERSEYIEESLELGVERPMMRESLPRLPPDWTMLPQRSSDQNSLPNSSAISKLDDRPSNASGSLAAIGAMMPSL